MRTRQLVCPLFLIVAAACSEHQSPTAPTAGPGLWIGEATVVSSSSGTACSSGQAAGSRLTQVLWWVEWRSGQITLEEDQARTFLDGPTYVGVINSRSRSFVASFADRPADSSQCASREGTIAGEFAVDWNSFEARQTLVSGIGESEGRVELAWKFRPQGFSP